MLVSIERRAAHHRTRKIQSRHLYDALSLSLKMKQQRSPECFYPIPEQIEAEPRGASHFSVVVIPYF